MPNNVHNKIEFDVKHADMIVSHCCPNGEMDFETLINPPDDMLREDVSVVTILQGTTCNWYNWQVKNWGTKWNAYGSKIVTDGDKASIKFSTAWCVPWPIIEAFRKRFQIPFTLKYMCESLDFWGQLNYTSGDTWELREKNRDDFRPIYIDMTGNDPDEETL